MAYVINYNFTPKFEMTLRKYDIQCVLYSLSKTICSFRQDKGFIEEGSENRKYYSISFYNPQKDL